MTPSRTVLTLVALALLAPAAAAAEAQVGLASFVGAVAALDGVDADRDGVADAAEGALCMAEAAGDPTDGECVASDYVAPVLVRVDADRDGLDDRAEGALCDATPVVSVPCEGSDLQIPEEAVAGFAVDEGGGPASAYASVVPAGHVARARVVPVSGGVEAEVALDGDDGSSLLGPHALHPCADASDALRTKGCLEDADGDARLTHHEVLDGTDPTRADDPDDYGAGTWVDASVARAQGFLLP